MLLIAIFNAVCLAVVLLGWRFFPGRISNTVAEVSAGLAALPVLANQVTSLGIDWKEFVPSEIALRLVLSLAFWIWVARKIPDPAREALIDRGRRALLDDEEQEAWERDAREEAGRPEGPTGANEEAWRPERPTGANETAWRPGPTGTGERS